MSTTNLQTETTFVAVVGRVIVKLRKDKNKDQNSLASAIGVNQSTWSRIERGDSPMSIDQIALAAKYLGIQPSEILKEAEIAKKDLESKGVTVRLTRHVDAAKATTKSGVAFLGGAALGALIFAALSQNRNSES